MSIHARRGLIMVQADITPIPLSEIFSSVQGEGPLAGVRQIFLRTYGCHLTCSFCDTPESVTGYQPKNFTPPSYRIEQKPGSGSFEIRDNPVEVDDLLSELSTLQDHFGPFHSVAVTGGEPLMHPAFLSGLFPRIQGLGMKVYLETAGDLVRPFKKVEGGVDIVAMDIKLPSVTHQPPRWNQHAEFIAHLNTFPGMVFAKCIVSDQCDPGELKQAASLLRHVENTVPLVLQPLTPMTPSQAAPSARQLLDWQEMLLAITPDVRVIPQCHKMMGQL